MPNSDDTGPKGSPGPRMSLKAIAEQAVRAKNEAQNESTAQPVVAPSVSTTPLLQVQLPAPPNVPRFDQRVLPETAPRKDARAANRSAPGAIIAVLSAAIAGGTVWWFSQVTTPTPSASSPPAPAAATTTTTAAAPVNAAAAATALVASGTADTSASNGPAALVGPNATAAELGPSPEPHRGAEGSPTATARIAAKPQPAQSTEKKAPEPSSADIAKAIANVDRTSGPFLAGSGPPAPPPPPEAAPPNLTPSSGAVQAAVGSVLGNARACVAGDREPSRARVVFDSSGAVSAVVVSGPAAGTPAEACIKGALSKARVAPFQKPSYSVDTAIRP